MKYEQLAELRRPDCQVCVDGFVCEDHPDRAWPHDGCGGAGMPCQAPGCTGTHLEARVFFDSMIKAADQINASGRWEAVNASIERHAANPGAGNDWYLQLLAGMWFLASSDYLALKREYEAAKSRTDPGLLAWRARNLLELSVWATYATLDRDNARRLYEDAGRDARDVFKIFEAWGAAHDLDEEWTSRLEQGHADLLARAAKEDIASLDGRFKQVGEAAKECGMAEAFNVFNRKLSKFAHPTAMQMISGPDAQRETLQQLVFFANGCLFFGGAFEKLERVLIRPTLDEAEPKSEGEPPAS